MATVLIEEHPGKKTLVIKLNNPPGNAFTLEMLSELSEVLSNTEKNVELNSIILTSNLRLFSAGGDLAGMKYGVDRGVPDEYVNTIVPKVNEFLLQIINHPLPIISAINGSVAGGGMGVAMFCDYIIAVTNSKFAPAFGALALTPDSGTSIILPRKLGKGVAFKAITQAETLQAEELLNMNAIDEIVATEDLADRALEIANGFANADRETTAQTKRLLNLILIEEMQKRGPIELSNIASASRRPAFGQRLSSTLDKLAKK